MYIVPANLQTDPSVVSDYIRRHGFATLVSTHREDTAITHTPLTLHPVDGVDYLYGHLARANDQCRHITQNSRATAVFMDTHTYISSSWYDHVNVPTWNYLAVHIHGRLEALTEQQTLDSLHQLVSQYEDASGPHFHISQMTPGDLKAHLRGLMGFRLKIEKTEASWKLSQNRDDKNYQTIIQKLHERGDDLSLAIAMEMEKMRPSASK